VYTSGAPARAGVLRFAQAQHIADGIASVVQADFKRLRAGQDRLKNFRVGLEKVILTACRPLIGYSGAQLGQQGGFDGAGEGDRPLGERAAGLDFEGQYFRIRQHGLGGSLDSVAEKMECCCCHSRNLAVSKGSNAVHPMGHPMNHSHHVGFRGPIWVGGNPRFSRARRLLLPPFNPALVSVWSREMAVAKPYPDFFPGYGRL
jgi:hypothetical protein